MAATLTVTGRTVAYARDVEHWTLAALLRPLHALMAAPSVLFLATLGIMLFRPPDLHLCLLDRVSLGVLIAVVALRALILRQPLRLVGEITWPLLALLGMGLIDLLGQPYHVENWSVLAAKYAVPLVLFHAARLVITDAQSRRWFETCTLAALGYLCLIAILFLIGQTSLIFPSFIGDENLGIHADRARGPFLEALTNGLAINLFALVALDSFRRRRLHGGAAFLLLASLPLAILATKTRAVWLAFCLSVVAVALLSLDRRLRRACLGISAVAVLGVLVVLASAASSRSLIERFAERSPVEFRLELDRAGWEMFCDRPLLGWGSQMQAGLLDRVSGFHNDRFFFHNTYLEIAVEHGVLGLACYLWLFVSLFRIGSNPGSAHSANQFPDSESRRLWPVMVGVYLLTACFVVMNYQFVNGWLFSLAGIYSVQNEGAA